MNLLTRKAKIRWQCRRGMLELDLLLSRFLQKQLSEMDESRLTVFEDLLTSSDIELYDWLLGNSYPCKKEWSDLVAFIRMQTDL